MKIYQEINDLSEFKPWSGAVTTWENICCKDLGEEFIEVLSEQDGEFLISETELNDFLWHEPEEAYALVGLDENGNWPETEEEDDTEN